MNKTQSILLGVLLLLSGVVARGIISGIRERSAINSNNLSREAFRQNKHTIDSVVALLKTGNLVLRSGLGADSYLLSRMNRKDKSYSHCGIVITEGGYPFVYHSIGGEDNPDQRLRRDSADVFFSPLNNDGIAVVSYGLDSSKTDSLKSVVVQFYRDRPKFDIKFDLRTNDALYCSEFVYKAFNKALNDTGFIRPSYVRGYSYVGTDDLFLNGHARFVCRIKFK